MGFRPHIHTKHEIEYGGPSFGLNYADKEVLNWLKENGVKVVGSGDCCEDIEWKIDKDQLRAIPESAFHDLKDCSMAQTIVEKDDLKQFVKDLIESKAQDEYAYVTWF